MCSLKNRPDNILKAGRRVVCVKAKAVFGRPAHVEGLNTRRTNNVASFTSQAAQGSEKTAIVSNRAFSVRACHVLEPLPKSTIFMFEDLLIYSQTSIRSDTFV